MVPACQPVTSAMVNQTARIRQMKTVVVSQITHFLLVVVGPVLRTHQDRISASVKKKFITIITFYFIFLWLEFNICIGKYWPATCVNITNSKLREINCSEINLNLAITL